MGFNNAVKGELCLTCKLLSMKNLRSLLTWATPILTQWVIILLEDEMDDNTNCNKKQFTVDMEYDLNNSLGELEPTWKSDIAAMWNMIEELQEMLNNVM